MLKSARIHRGITASGPRANAGAVALLLITACGPAQAFPVDFDNSDIDARFDVGVRYTAGIRTGAINSKIGNDPNFDESDYRFKQGDLVTSRLDLLVDFDLVYANDFGFRVSATSFFDPVYNSARIRTNPGTYRYHFDQLPVGCSGAATDLPICDTAVPYSAVGSYFDNTITSRTQSFYNGPRAEILDGFIFGRWDVGDTVLSARLGQHSQFWGEGLFFPFYGIAYSQGPIDGLKAVANPGIQAKEVFLPTPQISTELLVNDDLSIAAQYYIQYKRGRFPEGGTFLGAADLLFDGPDRLFSAVVLPAGLACVLVAAAGGTAPADCLTAPQPVFLDRRDYKKPGGQSYGAKVKYRASFLSQSATVGLYFRHFTDTINFPTPQIILTPFTPERGGGLNTGTYRIVYAQGTEIYGLSYTDTVGSVSVAGEASYRHRAALINSGITEDGKGPRGDVIFASVNGIALLPDLYVFPSGQLIGEVVWSHLLSVGENKDLFKYAKQGNAGCPTGDKLFGCATRDFVTAQISLTPQYNNLIPSTLLTLPINANYGIYGNNAAVGGGYEGAITASFGVAALYKARYNIQLSYIKSYYPTHGGVTAQGIYAGGQGNYSNNDRDWVSLILNTTF